MSLPEGWRETTLGEVSTRIGDGLHGTPKYSTDGDYFFVNGNNLLDGKIILKSDTKKVDKTQFDKYKKELGKSTILVSINGTIGNLAKYNNEKCILGKSAGYLNIKDDTNMEFIYYLMMDKRFQYDISKNANGSTIKNVSLAQLREYPINLPPLQEQKAIANILSSFDEKIELLKEQNETLEQMAQGVFREWFVDEVDESWEVKTLGEVTNIKGGATPSTKNEDFWNGDIHWTSPKDLSNSKSVFLLDTNKKITETGLKKISSGLLPRGTLLLSSRAPIGYLAISNVDIAINQGYIALLDDAYFSNYYMYFWLKTYMRLVEGASNGSTFQEISKSAFRQIECIVPNKENIEKFDDFVKSIFDKLLLNIEEINTLEKTRDTLLPKLMSGELRVIL